MVVVWPWPVCCVVSLGVCLACGEYVCAECLCVVCGFAFESLHVWDVWCWFCVGVCSGVLWVVMLCVGCV